MSTTQHETEPGPRTVTETLSEKFRFELRDLGRKLPAAKHWKQSRFPLSLLFSILFGVVLPAVTLAIELGTRMCGGTFFDPIPTNWHALLVALVPASNLAVIWAVARKKLRRPATVAVSNAFAIGISGFYSLVFAPLFPLAVIAVLFYGIGFLALSPLLSLISALVLRRSYRRLAVDSGSPAHLPRLWPGAALGLTLLMLADAPAAVTQLSLRRAASHNAGERDAGVRFLRQFGDRDSMLRACYPRPGRAVDLLGFLFFFTDPVSTRNAQKVYYRVTGKSFASELRPGFVGRGIFNFDPEQGGTNVGTTLDGLSLDASRLDGSIDATASLAYLEWTMVFQNARPVQREARAQVQLPPGAVVSRVTLWVNGEEREAAFGPRGRVREAYERIVQARRDPLLVTTTGTDRVLIQCFPVPPRGEMKIRIGTTQPLKRDDELTSILTLPHFVEHNFAVSDVEHLVWIESDSELQASSAFLQPDHSPEGVFGLRGTVRDSSLRDPAQHIRLHHAPTDGFAWAADSLQPETHVVHQRIEREIRPPASRAIVVIDGSVGMNPFLPEIAEALSSLPENVDREILVAGDNVIQLGNDASILAKFQGEGGADSVPALSEAFERTAGDPRALILWIHGPQPVLLGRPEGLRRNWERRPGYPVLFAVQAEPGLNCVLESLEGLPEVQSIIRSGELREDLGRLLSSWGNPREELVFVRERIVKKSDGSGDWGRPTSGHLARLWANDEVLRLTKSRKKEDLDEAVSLATSYQIVTPVSGAVVLETQAQYEQAGLEPADPRTVPTIPEPEVWMLMLVLSGLMGWKLLSGRRQWNGV